MPLSLEVRVRVILRDRLRDRVFIDEWRLVLVNPDSNPNPCPNPQA